MKLFLKRVLGLIAGVFELIIKLLGRFIGLILLAALSLILLSFLAVYLSGDGSLMFATNAMLIESSLKEISAFFIRESHLYTTLGISLVLLTAFPFISILALTFLLFGSRSALRYMLFFALVSGLIGLFLFGYTGFQISKDYRAFTTLSQENILSPSSIDTLNIKLLVDQSGFIDDDYQVIISENSMRLKTVTLGIGASSDSLIKLVVKKKALAANRQRSKELAETFEYDFELRDDTLLLTPEITIHSGERWHAQEVELHLLVPEGQKLHIDSKVRKLMLDHLEKPTEQAIDIWEMKNGDLICRSC